MKISKDLIVNLDIDFTAKGRLYAKMNEIPCAGWLDLADLVGRASIPDISRYLIADGHTAQVMQLASMCLDGAIRHCCDDETTTGLTAIHAYANQYIGLAKSKISMVVANAETIRDGCAKTDTKHDASSTASAAANIGRAIQQLLTIGNDNSSQYILSAIDDALYAIESEPNKKEIMAEIEEGLRKIIRECP